MHFGLLAHDAVRWLIGAEIDVHRKIEAFCLDQTNVDYVDVAGPPTDDDLVRYRRNHSKSVGLPCVRLQLRMVRHHLNGAPGVRVICTDREIEEIGRWRFAALRRPSARGAA